MPPGAKPPGRKSNTPLIVGIVGGAVALVLLCCGGLYIIGSEEQKKQAAASASVSADATTAAVVVPGVQATTAAPTEPPTAAPTSADARTSSPSPAGPKTVAMPKVTGENAAIADDRLRKLGFTNIQYGSQDRDDTVVLLLSNWTVTKQSTASGKKIKTDTLIVLTCTKQG